MPSINPLFNPLDPSTFTTTTRQQRRNYNYVVEVQSQTASGLPSTQIITVASNTVLTEEQILGTAGSYVQNSKYKEIQGDITDINVVNAYKTEGVS